MHRHVSASADAGVMDGRNSPGISRPGPALWLENEPPREHATQAEWSVMTKRATASRSIPNLGQPADAGLSGKQRSVCNRAGAVSNGELRYISMHGRSSISSPLCGSHTSNRRLYASEMPS